MWISALTPTGQHCFGGLARVTWKEKGMKGIQIRKEEMKLYLLANDMVVSVKI